MRLPEHAAHAIRRLERAGFEAWAVGGCVRDSLRGVEPHDWDLCTSASPAQMQAVFADARVLTTGLRHGTLTVLTDGGPLEITTYRTEGGYSDGRHPNGVRFVTDIREDLARRDFTVGAMAWHPERGLCDPFGGQTDLKNGVLRAVGQVPAEPVLRWAMLLHDSGKPACKTVDEQGIGHFRGHPRASLALSRELLPRLRFSSADTERILLLVERHDTPLGDNEKLVRRSLSRIGEARFRDLLAIKKGDAVGQGTSRDYVAQLFETEALLNRVLTQEQCFSLRQLAVNGADLQALGLRGRPVGEMLHALLDAVIDGQTDNRRETLLRLARTRMEEQHDK